VALDREVVGVEHLIEFSVVVSEAAKADQFDEDDVRAVGEHCGNAAQEPPAKDEQRHEQAEGDNDQLAFAHRVVPKMITSSVTAGCTLRAWLLHSLPPNS